MNTFFFLFISKSALLTPATRGVFWFLVTFTLCFVLVHLIKYLLTNRRRRDSSPSAEPSQPQKEEKEKAPTPAAPEPIYYIVEKKRRRTKPNYGEPKEIRFK